MRVLDLGCGRGVSSIFLAKEYGVLVWATDLRINATDNFRRIQEAGVADRVFPLQVDARTLPYAQAFFGAILCVDAYIYFGTDDLCLNYLHQFVKPRGQIGIVVPGFRQEVDGLLPEHLLPFWAQECWTWHTLQSWQWHWSRTGLSMYLLIVPVVMLRSSIFSRLTAYVGILAAILNWGLYVPRIGLFLSILSVVPLANWLILIARRLFQLGRTGR